MEVESASAVATQIPYQMNVVDIKLLWGRAGGICSKPDCTEDLTALLETGNYVIGEMAHVIGRRPSARRGIPSGGEDTYKNLILLCPTHHTHIDKAPEGTYPEAMLHQWKKKHEESIRTAAGPKRYHTFDELRKEISRILTSNKTLFAALGPQSEPAITDPNSNLVSIWNLRRLDRIIPNNQKILNLIDANWKLLSPEAVAASEKFRVHAEAYKHHVYDALDQYPTFPEEFGTVFSEQ